MSDVLSSILRTEAKPHRCFWCKKPRKPRRCECPEKIESGATAQRYGWATPENYCRFHQCDCFDNEIKQLQAERDEFLRKGEDLCYTVGNLMIQNHRLVEACKKALTCASLNSDVRNLITDTIKSSKFSVEENERIEPDRRAQLQNLADILKRALKIQSQKEPEGK
ncbi:MAG TPA: hypothetical protein VGD05_07065 [Pyrinomonadaceae bacterium]|jgi:hypothetical protein